MLGLYIFIPTFWLRSDEKGILSAGAWAREGECDSEGLNEGSLERVEEGLLPAYHKLPGQSTPPGASAPQLQTL